MSEVMTPEQLQARLHLASVLTLMFQLPGGAALRTVVTANLRSHAVAISADVCGPGVCYRLTAFRAE